MKVPDVNGDDDSVEEEMEEAEERDTNPTIVVKEEVVEPPKVRFILSGGKTHIPASRYLQNPPNVRNIMSQKNGIWFWILLLYDIHIQSILQATKNVS